MPGPTLSLLWPQKYKSANDFGGEIIPEAAKSYNVVAYPFYGYWEDIGTVKSFFEENLKLCRHVSSGGPVWGLLEGFRGFGGTGKWGTVGRRKISGAGL